MPKICYNCFQEKDDAPVCQHCFYNENENKGRYPVALPEGTILGGNLTVGRVLGQGGFGITYIAKDNKTGQRVAVKEYFPDTMAMRTSTRSVSAYSGERGEGFKYGKQCFLEEAKTLAAFNGNNNIVRVHRYFEENDTAYFVMEYIEGTSLKQYLKKRGGKISFEETKRYLIPILDALAAVHAKGIIHRDISPDNIVITKKDGTVKLLDFGAARYSIGDKSRSLDVVLKHGYAPREQYTRHGRQGPYTDIYSFAATFYRCITGFTPPDSIDRLDRDEILSPRPYCPDLTKQGEIALYKALSVQPINRYQNVAEFKHALLSHTQTQPGTPNFSRTAASAPLPKTERTVLPRQQFSNRPQPQPQMNRPQPQPQMNRPQPQPQMNRPQPQPQVNRPQPQPQVNRPQPQPQMNRPQPQPQMNRPQGGRSVQPPAPNGKKQLSSVAVALIAFGITAGTLLIILLIILLTM